MTATQIDNAYDDLLSSIDREFRRLEQKIAEQKMKEEQERLKTIQVNICVSIFFFPMIIFRLNLKVKKVENFKKINNLKKKKKNFDSKNYFVIDDYFLIYI